MTIFITILCIELGFLYELTAALMLKIGQKHILTKLLFCYFQGKKIPKQAQIRFFKFSGECMHDSGNRTTKIFGKVTSA